MYTYIHIFKPTSYISNKIRSPSYIISLPRTELLKYSFIFIVVSHYEYGVCENKCVSVWMSGKGGEGVCVEVEGDMIEYIQNICNSVYPTHVHVTNLLSINFISRVEINVILKPFLTITILLIQFSTSIWISSKIYMCNIWIIHVFNALSLITLVTQIRSGIIYHNLVYYIYVQLKFIYP